MLMRQRHENRVKTFITYILSNTRFINYLKVFAFLVWPSVGKLCVEKNALSIFIYKTIKRLGAAILHNGNCEAHHELI